MGEDCDLDKLSHILHRMKTASFTNVALKIVLFSQQDIDFAVQLEDALKGLVHPGMLFFSLGNSYPPTLEEDGSLESPLGGDEHRLKLLKDYRCLVDDMIQDPRIQHWRFFPQMHVLLWSNESEK